MQEGNHKQSVPFKTDTSDGRHFEYFGVKTREVILYTSTNSVKMGLSRYLFNDLAFLGANVNLNPFILWLSLLLSRRLYLFLQPYDQLICIKEKQILKNLTLKHKERRKPKSSNSS